MSPLKAFVKERQSSEGDQMNSVSVTFKQTNHICHCCYYFIQATTAQGFLLV